MERNNGKIAIAIVAMFVVALSIVGFTYAYFIATVDDNDAVKSVEVTAGVLEIEYANSNRIYAKNLVPGWINDGKHYYDPVASVDADGHVTAAVKGATNAMIAEPNENDGIATPATINVTNTKSTDTAYYAIRLVDIENGLEDPDNFYVTLYSTTAADATSGGTKVWKGNLESTKTTQIIVPNEQSIAVNGEAHYYIELEYVNNDDQKDSMGKTIKATVDVIGISQNNEKTGWFDADNNPVTFVASM